MSKSKFAAQFHRHLRVALLLLLVTLVLAYASSVYLRYFPREHGYPPTLVNIANAWLLPSIFAVSTTSAFCSTYFIGRGVNLGFIRFLPLFFLILGFSIKHMLL